MGGKSAPEPPDYTAAAEKTAQADKEVVNMQTWANRPEQQTPWGSTTWDTRARIDPATGQKVTEWTQNLNLTPESQRALDAQLKLTGDRSELAGSMTGRMQDEYAEAMDWEQFSAAGGIPEVGGPVGLSDEGLQGISSADRYYDEAGNAIYGQATSRLDPQWSQREEQKKAELYNQGLRPGDEAFDTELANFSRDRNDAYQQAQYGATIGAGAEANRMLGMDSAVRKQVFGERQTMGDVERAELGRTFGQELSASNLMTQQRQQQISEELQRRGHTLNEINAILHGQQVQTPDMPSFNTASRSQGADYSGAARDQFGAEMDVFSQESENANSAMSAVGSIGGSAMKFSDRRLKRNIVYLGKILGNKWYRWTYLWGEKGCGVMADEAPPHAVHRHSSGYLMVDYGAL